MGRAPDIGKIVEAVMEGVDGGVLDALAAEKAVREALAKYDRCLSRLHPDEPIFVLRAADRHATSLVRRWADICQSSGTPQTKVAEARQLALQMEEWQERNRRLVKQPD